MVIKILFFGISSYTLPNQMVESNKNKGLFLGIAAAAAVVGAALLYHFVIAGDDEEPAS